MHAQSNIHTRTNMRSCFILSILLGVSACSPMRQPQSSPVSPPVPTPSGTAEPPEPPPRDAPPAASAAPEVSGCPMGTEREDYPAISLDHRISDQVVLYGGDRVEIVGADVDPDSVDFGRWEPFQRGRVYVVWAPDGAPFHPSFQGRTRELKLHIRYTCYVDRTRDLRLKTPSRPPSKK